MMTKENKFRNVFISGGRKRIKDIKVPINKKKRTAISALSSEDETRTEAVVKTPKSTKKQKVIQEKETRKVQKVNHHHFYSSLTCIESALFFFPLEQNTFILNLYKKKQFLLLVFFSSEFIFCSVYFLVQYMYSVHLCVYLAKLLLCFSLLLIFDF